MNASATDGVEVVPRGLFRPHDVPLRDGSVVRFASQSPVLSPGGTDLIPGADASHSWYFFERIPLSTVRRRDLGSDAALRDDLDDIRESASATARFCAAEGHHAVADGWDEWLADDDMSVEFSSPQGESRILAVLRCGAPVTVRVNGFVRHHGRIVFYLDGFAGNRRFLLPTLIVRDTDLVSVNDVPVEELRIAETP